ncbi:phosphoribosylglycinamide formyltransferase [Williamsia sterculiae]|uniref:phosphoribosylglycinamide formyltransferase n=1 Tax=Williamsia sterculiae TaxID=1344003 RepID=UPI003899BB02
MSRGPAHRYDHSEEPVLNVSPDPAAPIVVLASGTGTLLSALLDAGDGPDSPFRVVAVVTDRDCPAAAIAVRRDLPVHVLPIGTHASRVEWDVGMTAAVAGYRPRVVVTAGFMKILGSAFLDEFAGRIINSHPALLPAFPGAHAVADALAHGVKVSGCTVHLVDAGVDTGPILAQAPVFVEPEDDEITLHERIKAVERGLLATVVAAVIRTGVDIDGRKAHIR